MSLTPRKVYRIAPLDVVYNKIYIYNKINYISS